MPNKIIGFSKLSRVEKIDWLNKNILDKLINRLKKIHGVDKVVRF